MAGADDAQAQRLAEARAALLEGLGLTPDRAQRLGIDVAQLDIIVAAGLSLEEAIARGLLAFPPEAARELMGESIRALQQHAIAKGLDQMAEEEIEDEIKAARTAGPNQRR